MKQILKFIKFLIVKILTIRLDIAIFSSLLIIIILFVYSFMAVSKFYTFKNIVAPKITLTLDTFHFILKNEVKREIINFKAIDQLRDDESKLKTFHITVKQSNLDKLNANLPTSGKEQYVDGLMQIGNNKVSKIKLRYRGDGNTHWLYKQKSLRIKFKDNNLYELQNTFNLLNTVTSNIIMDAVNYQLSSQSGLISQEYYPVRVFINNEYSGVYMFLSQTDESLLRKHKIMPGSIYTGDGASDKNKDGVSDLWWSSDFWKKRASRNAEQKNIRTDIDSFINIINKNSISFYNNFNLFFNKEKIYSFISHDVLFGTYHHDFAHNHKIYFDPYKGKFEPIAWDQRRWTDWQYKDTSNYLLVEKIKLNPILEYERDIVLYRLFKKYTLKYVSSLLDFYSDAQYMDLKADTNRDEGYPLANLKNIEFTSIPFTMKEYDKSINILKEKYKKRRIYLKNLFDNTNIVYTVTDYKGYSKVTFFVDGNTPITLSASNIDISLDYNFDEQVNEIWNSSITTILYPGRKFKDGHPMNWRSYGYGKHYLIPAKEKYTFFIKKFDITKISLKNSITNKIILANKIPNSIEVSPDSIHPWKLPKPKYKHKTLKGNIEVNKTLIFDKYTAVNIEANTTFIIDSNASIYFYGKVTAIGTKEKPIKFIAKDSKKPWGLVAVQGKATTGSKFEYCEFENGSIDTRNLIHYTSPFNIHDMDWFEVRNCKIGRNFVGDDAMHIAYATGIVDGCEFTDARSDGLDIDISDVNITNNIFYKSGNDGLDIMTTTMNASNNLFIDMGDKGISVGEWSDANITDSFFLRTVIGLEVKDKSKVIADNLTFIDSKEKAINLYNKNKRYDTGGFLEADYIYLLGNKIVKADKRSEFTIKDKKEDVLPDFKSTKWYKNIENTPYLKFINEIEVKYAK